MSNPIKTASTALPSANAASTSTNLSDMLGRLGGRGEGSGQESFARWMSQHQAPPQGSLQASPQAGPQSSPRKPAAVAPAPRPVAAVASQQALATARLQAGRAAARAAADADGAAAEPANSKPVDNKPAQRARTDNVSRPANRAPASAQNEGADAASASPSGDEVSRAREEPAAEDQVNFSTALGDGAAMVRELTPPATVQGGDTASMMAWLVSLTQADGAAAQDAAAAAELGDAESGVDESTPGIGRDDDKPGRGLGRGGSQGLALGAGGGLALGQRDGALDGRGGAAAAALQVDKLLGPGDANPLGRDGDPMAALMAADGSRAASFGQTLSNLSPARHESASIPVPLHSPEFGQKLADQVSLWVGQVRQDGPMTAELHLNPAEMGPINVKISLDGNSAQVEFVAAALETRQAIEASLSNLSTALNDVGLNLTGGGVSSQTPQQQSFAQGSRPEQGGTANRAGSAREGDGSEDEEASGMRQVGAPRAGRLGGLDLYA